MTLPYAYTAPPTASSVPAGAPSVTYSGGASSIHDALDDFGAGYVIGNTDPAIAATQTFTVTHTPPWGPGSIYHLDYIQTQSQQLFLADSGWWYPARVIGYVGSVPHSVSLTSAASGVGDGVMNNEWGPITTQAADGTPWSSCSRIDVEWRINIVWSHSSSGFSTNWNDGIGSPNPAVLYYATLNLWYTALPAVTNVTPSGTVTTPQPTVGWFGADQNGYRVVVVAAGTLDGAGVAAGAAGFDASTAVTKAWDSGVVYSTGGRVLVESPLANGTYRPYVQLYVQTSGERLSSDWTTNAGMTVSAETVDQPTVSLANDSGSNTVQVTVNAGTHVGGQQVATYIEVQYLHPTDGWVAASIANSRVVGTGTSIFYDGLQAPGASVSYRARGLYVRPSDGFSAASAWATSASFTRTDRHEWWLLSTTDHTLNRALSSTSTLLVKDWKPARKVPQSVTWGIGARAATITHDVVKSNVMSLSVWAMTAAARTALLALIESGEDLVLLSEWGEMWRAQVGDQIAESQVKAAPRPGETTAIGMVRVFDFSLIEVVSP